MIIEMNIEAEDLDAAAQFVRDLLPGPKGYVHTRVAIAEYEGPKGIERNGVLIVRAVVDSKAAAIGYAYQIAEQFDQDCVALLDARLRLDAGAAEGMLVGPNAVKWGAFDPKFFRRF